MNTVAKDLSDSPMTLEQAVWVDPGRMSGAPCFRGSRLPIQQLFDWLADGVPLDDFVRDFRIDRRAAAAVLLAAGQALCTTAAQRQAAPGKATSAPATPSEGASRCRNLAPPETSPPGCAWRHACRERC